MKLLSVIKLATTTTWIVSMDSNVIAAFIGAGGTIFGAALPLLWQNLSLTQPSLRTLNELAGNWKGTSQQRDKSGSVVTNEIDMQIRTSWRKIKGFAQVRARNKDVSLILEGIHQPHDHILLNYRSSKSGLLNFGTIFLRLDGNGANLNGKVVGYGNQEEGMVEAQVNLSKRS